MASRKIEDLTPKMRSLYAAFAREMAQAGIRFIVTCTARTVKEQLALYAQGRQPLDEVNQLRTIAGLPWITEEQNRRKVTWTLNSEHLIDLDDSNPLNDHARAFDIALVKNVKEIYWDIKEDVNDNQIPDYREAGLIGEKVGLIWGGRWKTPDYPHFQQPK